MDTAVALTDTEGSPPSAVWKLVGHLRRGELDAVKESLTTMPRDELIDAIRLIRRRLKGRAPADVLLDLLLANETVTFSHLALIAETLKLGETLERKDAVLRTIRRLAESPSPPVVYWGPNDRLRWYEGPGHEIAPDLGVLKYGCARELSALDLFDLAERFTTRLYLPRILLDNLYAISRSGLPREEWERQVKVAHCLDHIGQDMINILSMNGNLNDVVSDLVDHEAKEAALNKIDHTKGTILMSFHGGLLSAARGLYAKMFETGVAIQKNPRSKNGTIAVKDNSRAALFIAMRALQDRKVLFIAADGQYGGSTTTISVLGRSLQVGIGSAFLAYEVRCNTAWYTVLQYNRRFVPVIVPGPSRTAGEPFEAFKERLLRFVAENIESLLTGDPRNLALRGKWRRIMSARPQ